MAYKTVLLYLNDEQQAAQLIKSACAIASQHQAHLIGFFVVHPTQFYIGRAEGVGMPAELSSLLGREQLGRMKRIHKVFQKETENQNFQSEWRCIDERSPPIADTVLQEAATVDLLIVGYQYGNHLSDDIIHSILLASPVPVLLIPDGYNPNSYLERIFVAWNGKTEAARAVKGALPILQCAENVWIHQIQTPLDDEATIENSLLDIAANLSRHGVNVEISQSKSEQKDVGSTLFDLAKSNSAECMVLGAYGHSKIRKIFFGDTTDYAMKNLQIPLLLWH